MLSAADGQYDYNPVDLQQEVQSLMSPLAPSGSAIVATVEDLQSQTRIKLQRARQAVAATMDLLGFDLIEGSLWMDVRASRIRSVVRTCADRRLGCAAEGSAACPGNGRDSSALGSDACRCVHAQHRSRNVLRELPNEKTAAAVSRGCNPPP